MIEFQVPAISCAHCVRAVTEAVQEVDPQAKVDVDVQTKHVKVQSGAEPAKLVAALTEAGYPPH
ncbi:MAG: putative Heavy metal transport/detoxification protein [Ramlibacter sp.]|jgi:copper chaperone|nr:putative Heavy metal transport/detoxification protein [Ramlibacter sp.]